MTRIDGKLRATRQTEERGIVVDALGESFVVGVIGVLLLSGRINVERVAV